MVKQLKSACYQSQWPEFDSGNPHRRMKALTPSGCPLTFTHELWHASPYP